MRESGRLSAGVKALLTCSVIVAAVPAYAQAVQPEQSESPTWWTPDRIAELRSWIAGLGGLSEGTISPQDFVDRPAYRHLYVAHEHAIPILEESLGHADWSVRASSLHLLAQTRAKYCWLLLHQAFDSDSHEYVRALAAEALRLIYQDRKPSEELFPPRQDLSDEGCDDEPSSYPLQQLAVSMFGVAPKLSPEEMRILIDDLVRHTEKKNIWQETRDTAKPIETFEEARSPKQRLWRFGEAAYNALIEKYWATDKPWVKENIVQLLACEGFLQRDDRYFDVLDDASRYADKYLRWQVSLQLYDYQHPRLRAIWDRLRYDPWDRLREQIAAFDRIEAIEADQRERGRKERERLEQTAREHEESAKAVARLREEAQRRWEQYIAQDPMTWEQWVQKNALRKSPIDWKYLKDGVKPEEWQEILAAAEKLGVNIQLPAESEAGLQSPPADANKPPAVKADEEPWYRDSLYRSAVLGGLAVIALTVLLILRLRR